MNDIVFAGKYSVYEKQLQKFNKCLRVLAPHCNSDRLAADRPDGRVKCGEGDDDRERLEPCGYAVIPPYARHVLTDIDGDDLTVCIEQPLISTALQVALIGGEHCGSMRWAVREAERYFGKEDGGAVLSALGQLIVAYVIENYHEPLHPVIRSLKADLEKNFADSAFSADAAISKLPLNGDYVRKLFKKEIGVTPHDFLNGLRMQRAKSLILSGISNNYSHYTVSQIAEACGFAEPLYFSRAFKKYFGVSPMKFISENSVR